MARGNKPFKPLSRVEKRITCATSDLNMCVCVCRLGTDAKRNGPCSRVEWLTQRRIISGPYKLKAPLIQQQQPFDRRVVK